MPQSERRNFSEKIGRLIRLYPISQAAMARRIGMHPSHLNLFLKGHRDLHSQRLVSLLRELGIDLEDLLEEAFKKRVRSKEDMAPETEHEKISRQFMELPSAERDSLQMIISRLSMEKNSPYQQEEET